MGYNLFLDDERMPKEVQWIELPLCHWQIVRSYKQFVETIQKMGLPSIVSFDHDLADEHYTEYVVANDEKMVTCGTIRYNRFREKTGYDAAKWLVEYCLDHKLSLPEYYIHSFNPIGKENIKSVLKSFEKLSTL